MGHDHPSLDQEIPAPATTAGQDADKILIEDLMDRIDGLESELEQAVEVAISRGALDWARLNFPRHRALKPDAPQLCVAAAAGLSALQSVLAGHRAAVSAASRHLSGRPAEGGFEDMSREEVEDFLAFHQRSVLHMEAVIAAFEPETREVMEQRRLEELRKVARAERQACENAVGMTAAPVEGTPYITGPRKFCMAIRAMPPVEETSVAPVLKAAT